MQPQAIGNLQCRAGREAAQRVLESQGRLQELQAAIAASMAKLESIAAERATLPAAPDGRLPDLHCQPQQPTLLSESNCDT